jgi:hypothetical protein
MIRRLVIAAIALTIAACGGGGGGGGSSGGGGGTTSTSSSSALSSSSSSSSSSAALSNFTTITIDGGPSSLSYSTANVPYVSVTLCVPGTTTCQTIDHIILDTGSVGLRIEREALNAPMLAGLPAVLDSLSATPLAQCYQYVDGYVWGSVRTGDFSIGGESVSGMPFQVIADNGVYSTVPSACSSAGGTFHNSIEEFGAKGILGIGMSTVDCGSSCANGTAIAPRYYRCNTADCQTPTTIATTAQIPNPVARFAVNNNGTVIDLPQPSGLGARTLSGTLYFGIGTQTNNRLGTASVLPTTMSARFTATYKGTALSNSFLDSGTNFLGFPDAAITSCTGALAGFYCAGQTLSLSAVLSNGSVSRNVTLTLNDTQTLAQTNNTALVGLGGDPARFGDFDQTALTNSFDFGLPFYFGRRVYTGINGRTAETYTGPFVAF